MYNTIGITARDNVVTFFGNVVYMLTACRENVF